jgi:hypothetical protein
MDDETEVVGCRGCGGPLAPNKAPGPARMWCSDRCRKEQYAKTCVDCGTRIDGTTPGRSRGRCRACANKVPRPSDVIHRATVEALWADGRTLREISDFLGCGYNSSIVSNWRSRGYDLPHRRTAEQIARITAGSDERLAKGRRVWKEMRRERP